jgi:hypothetical protein
MARWLVKGGVLTHPYPNHQVVVVKNDRKECIA